MWRMTRLKPCSFYRTAETERALMRCPVAPTGLAEILLGCVSRTALRLSWAILFGSLRERYLRPG